MKKETKVISTDKAEEYHSDIIEELLELKQPNLDDYNGDGSTSDYIKDTLVYIEGLKRYHETVLEMYAIAMDEDKQSIENQNKLIQQFMTWYNDVPFGNDKPIEQAKFWQVF